MCAVERDGVWKCEESTLPPALFKLSKRIKRMNILMELDTMNGVLLKALVSE